MKLSNLLYFVTCDHNKICALYLRDGENPLDKENHLKLSVRHISVLLLVLFVASGCGPSRRLADDEQLLWQNNIDFEDDHAISKSELNDIIKQQPNRKFLGLFRLSLWVHNLPNPQVVERNARAKQQHLEEKNRAREAEGKLPKRYKRTFGEWLQHGVGDPPVILDTMLVIRSADQIGLYMLKEGYFKNEVSYSVDSLKRKKARVNYVLTSGPAHHIREIRRVIPDDNLRNIVEMESKSELLAPGQRFSVSRMDRERDRLLSAFKNRGYYDMIKDDIYFQVDSTIGNLQVDLVMGIRQNRARDPLNRDSLIAVDHIRYRLENITINRSYNAFRGVGAQTAAQEYDTTYFNKYTIVGEPSLRVKPNIIAQNVRFEQGDFYSQEDRENTHRALSSLDIFSAVNVRFERLPSEREGEGLLDCQIQLTPAKKQQFVFETRGTHNAGFFGTAGSVTYRNRNIFRGAEVFRFRVSGAIEAQQLLTGSSTISETTLNVQEQGTVFNTIEFVPEVSLTFPKFLFPIQLDRIAKSARPFTTVSLSYGFQQRPDFRRNMIRGTMSYRWRESDFKTWIVTPLEVSLIKIFKSDEFQQRLDQLNDLFLNASYSDHLISAIKVSYIFNNQILSRRTNTFYYRGNAETAGNTLQGIMSLSGAERDTLGSYRIANIRFANYIRTDHDLRYYRRFSENSSMVFRFYGGVGVPLRNLEVMPFERSFFGGGANGIRAWQIQTLGPGSFSSVLTTFDRIGEAQLETNLEYRQKIVSVFEAAIFADVGNIWLLKPDPVRLGGDFAIDRFLSELAIGAGVGLRLNFDFFIIRFDLAMQLRDPSMIPGERWAFEPKENFNQRVDEYNATNPARRANYYSPRLNLNLGIGYPF